MLCRPEKIGLDQWDSRFRDWTRRGRKMPANVGPISKHVTGGDYRLKQLKYDNSYAALQLWNLLLTEDERLAEAKRKGKKIVGAMKDLGTVPVLACSLENIVTFYPDGAWWIPCITELNDQVLNAAASLGIDESFCPVRAMIGAFVTKTRFPLPDRLVCSTGATCDDFSAIAQRLEPLGFPVVWWEMPHRRHPEKGERKVTLPGGFTAPASQVGFVKTELTRVVSVLEELSAEKLDNRKLAFGIKKANIIRRYLDEIRELVFTAEVCPLPALEMLIVEMFALHFCSDLNQATIVLKNLLNEVHRCSLEPHIVSTLCR